MNYKIVSQTKTDIRKTPYHNLKRQQCALNMQIRLAMQSYDMNTKVKLEKELAKIEEQIKELGGF